MMDGVEIGWLVAWIRLFGYTSWQHLPGNTFLAPGFWFPALGFWFLAPGSGSTMHYLTGATPSWLLDRFPVCDVIAVQR